MLSIFGFLEISPKLVEVPKSPDIVIRNLLTLFGDHNSQTPSTPGIFMHINIAKKNTYNSVHTYAITSHLLLKQRQYNKCQMIFPSKSYSLPAERNESKSELKFCQVLKPYKCKMDMSHMRWLVGLKG